MSSRAENKLTQIQILQLARSSELDELTSLEQGEFASFFLLKKKGELNFKLTLLPILSVVAETMHGEATR